MTILYKKLFIQRSEGSLIVKPHSTTLPRLAADWLYSFVLIQKKQKIKAVKHYSDYAILTSIATEKCPMKNRTAFCLGQ
jgi:hypothetical protein